MSGTHGLIQHRTGYYYTILEEDYCEAFKGEGKNEVCRAYIVSILEQLTNRQFERTGSDEDIWVYMSIPEMARRMRHACSERTIHKELTGMIKDDYLAKRRAVGKATMEYKVNFKKINQALAALPDKQSCNSARYLLANLQEPSGNSARSTLQNYKNDLAELQPRINRDIPENKQEEQESTFTAIPTSPTSSSHDEDAHALSSEQEERTLQDDAHSPADPFQHHPPDSPPSQLPGRDGSGTQAKQPRVETAEPIAEPRIASTTPSTSQPEPAKAARKPRAPRKPKTPLLDLDEETRTRVVKVLDCLDSWRQEMTGNPDQRYSREDLQAIDAIVKILPLKPTPKRLRQICDGMWNTPRDMRTGFHWQKHMTVVNICKQYDTQSLELDAKEKKAASYASNISVLYSRPPAQAGDDEEELRFREPQSKRLALARKRG